MTSAWWVGVLGLMLGAVCSPVGAEVAWTCAISADGTRLDCSGDRTGAPHATAAASAASATTVRGMAFPLDPAKTYRVALWSPPTERRFVEQLAGATICFRTPGCRVVVRESAWIDPHPGARDRLLAGGGR